MVKDFDPERYNKRGQQSSNHSPMASQGVDESRQRITDLIAGRDKNATQTAKEYYGAKNKAKRDMTRQQAESDRGWGKTAMMGTSIGSMFGAPWLGAAAGGLLGLGKATANRNKFGGNSVGNFFKSLGDLGGGVVDPIMENPLLAASAAMSAAPYVGGDQTSFLGDLLGGSGGPGLGTGGQAEMLSLSPEFSGDMLPESFGSGTDLNFSLDAPSSDFSFGEPSDYTFGGGDDLSTGFFEDLDLEDWKKYL